MNEYVNPTFPVVEMIAEQMRWQLNTYQAAETICYSSLPHLLLCDLMPEELGEYMARYEVSTYSVSGNAHSLFWHSDYRALEGWRWQSVARLQFRKEEGHYGVVSMVLDVWLEVQNQPWRDKVAVPVGRYVLT